MFSGRPRSPRGERTGEREQKRQETRSSPFRPPAAAAGSCLHCCSPWSAQQTSTPPLYRGSTPERSEERRADHKCLSTCPLLRAHCSKQEEVTGQQDHYCCLPLSSGSKKVPYLPIPLKMGSIQLNHRESDCL